jgi:hypothetical protein
VASSKPGPLQEFYTTLLSKGMRPEMARLTLARKIATIVLIVWKRGGRMAISLATPELFSEVADSVTGHGYGDCVSLLREPDAANPHVRFDERGVETEAGRGSSGTDKRKGRQPIGCA